MKHMTWLGLIGIGLGINAFSAESYIAHEWGTFTSLQNSRGEIQEGLHHEEESLPEFVHGLQDSSFVFSKLTGQSVAAPAQCRKCKGVCCDEVARQPVTQKMETPVIYFYSQEPRSVQVTVDFPQGLITQWYPEAKTFSPLMNDGQHLSNGSITWNAELATSPLDVPWVEADGIWAPSRRVAANYLKSGNESERLLFYRGLGNFDVPVHVVDVTTPRAQTTLLSLQNDYSETIPDAFILRTDGHRGEVISIGVLNTKGSKRISSPELSSNSLTMDAYVEKASSQIHAALVKSGLYADEAQAMVDTWSKSYFRTPGLRMLYVLPRSLTDRILPIRMQPEPKELVRTLVGRIEIMTRAEEQSILANLNTQEGQTLGRFAEPKLRAVRQIAPLTVQKDRVSRMISKMN